MAQHKCASCYRRWSGADECPYCGGEVQRHDEQLPDDAVPSARGHKNRGVGLAHGRRMQIDDALRRRGARP